MQVSISDELKKRFHSACIIRGKTMTEVIIELIEKWLESNEVPETREIEKL